MSVREDFHSVDGPRVPYTTKVRRERSRELAQKRRTTYKSLMSDLAQQLPFSKDVISQVDYNSRLRLALSFFRVKSLLQEVPGEGGEVEVDYETEAGGEMMEYRKPAVFPLGMFQDLVTEALDGFILVALSDGTVEYVSENIHKHLGLFQSEHIGFSMYDLIFEEDQEEVKRKIHIAEANAFARLSNQGTAECSFFCRMKCSRFKVANTVTKSPGYKLVFVSGHFKASGGDPFLVTIVRPVSPPSILEIRMEGNMFVTHYSLDMRCIFSDGRLRHLMGYGKNELVGHVPFEFHHHEDVDATLECSRGIMTKGEGLSGYYRYMSQSGQFVWVQSRATLMFDSRTGKPSYIVCMNFVISKEAGEKDCALRQAITSGSSLRQDARSLDPFPVPREDAKAVNPLLDPDSSASGKSQISVVEEDEPTSTTGPADVPESHSGSSSSPVSSSRSQSHLLSHSSSISSHQASSRSISSAPRSSSSSPDDCLPDSTSTSSPNGSASRTASSASQVSDSGYFSGSLSSSTSSGTVSAHVSSREPVASSSYQDYTPTMSQQLSPDNPPSVFSPKSIASGLSNPPSVQRFQPATPLSNVRTSSSPAAVSFPNSIPKQFAVHSIPVSTSFHTPSDYQPERKFRPSFQPDYNFGAAHNTPLNSFSPTSTGHWNGHTPSPPYPTFPKQEGPRYSCQYTQPRGLQSNIDRHGSQTHPPFGFSSSVIILDSPAPFPPSRTTAEVKSEAQLPELTKEDLNILDFIDLMDDGLSTDQPSRYMHVQQNPHS